ncbi:hypothetical protein [Paraburkholderia tropica]|uniref:hypothetical protein n=1 Tax=Paraburkholderia tropica TaxID=92647 RepID=UPI002AB5E9E3|nr:hypothetical protein [Paraburkholderia tropica]
MKLISLKLLPRGVNGWESPTLQFGERLTSLFAPNGSGKTPIVQALAFCLGFDVKFRDDIRGHCEAAILTFDLDGKSGTIRREIASEFCVTVILDNVTREFFSESDYSKAIFSELGLALPALVATNRQQTHPYISTVLPIFYVRQDGGYNEPYRPPANFIQSQFVEMIRFIFGLSPRHSYTAKRDLLTAKDHLEAVQRRIVFQQKVVQDLLSRVDDTPGAHDLLVERVALLSRQFDELKESYNAQDAANSALTDMLGNKEEQIRRARREMANLRARIVGVETVRAEIEGEVRTLSLNEESKRMFETFFDICGRSDCALFVSSAESYGKNLLYLKDQIKDLNTNTTRMEVQVAVLEARLKDYEEERREIAVRLQKPETEGTSKQIVLATQVLTRQLLEAEQKRAESEQLLAEKRKYVAFDEERARTQDQIATLGNNGRADLEFSKLRLRVRELTVKWMDILATPNASREVEIDLDFKFKFGGEAIELFGGSTRSRLILAIHAALFEYYLERPEGPFRFLILDTPKQHELSSEDLRNFMDELLVVCDRLGGQVLISSTEYHHPISGRDREWLPQYDGEKQKMYLGLRKADQQ